jgi:hypothetical protein
MSGSWELVLHQQAARAFFNCRGSERRWLEHLFDSLATDPYQDFESETTDASGRPNRVRKSGRWSVVYWLDEMVKEIRIVSLERDV